MFLIFFISPQSLSSGVSLFCFSVFFFRFPSLKSFISAGRNFFHSGAGRGTWPPSGRRPTSCRHSCRRGRGSKVAARLPLEGEHGREVSTSAGSPARRITPDQWRRDLIWERLGADSGFECFGGGLKAKAVKQLTAYTLSQWSLAMTKKDKIY